MLLVWLCQALFGVAALGLCGVTCRAVLRRDERAHFFLTVAGSVALVFFVSVPRIPIEMIGIAVAAVIAGILMSPAEPTVALDSTATRKWRR
ncbi:MAG TPA: hypothetical protein VEU30_10725 [Thermoanaerobaculia bacterium]|nr:hypothetical protein [Thermoanaerobaculia bacterium]